MTGVTGRSAALPPLHEAWFVALTGLPAPVSEARATCGDCVMCDPARSGSSVVFEPDVKCCSYIPHLANFLAGRALGGQGRDSILERIDRRAGVTPLGLGLSFADIRRMSEAQAHFGVSAAVTCPHFDTATKGCAIWRTRNAVCSTWFCQHGRGAVSQRFWSAVRDLLIVVEERVAAACLEAGGIVGDHAAAVHGYRDAIRAQVSAVNSATALPAADPDDGSDEFYERMWGAWRGREEAWFRHCADFSASIRPADLAERFADDHPIDVVRACQAQLASHDLPDRLRFTPAAGSQANGETVHLVGYSPVDPVLLPVRALNTLAGLAGTPISDIREAFRGDPVLDDDALGTLHDFGVVTAAD